MTLIYRLRSLIAGIVFLFTTAILSTMALIVALTIENKTIENWIIETWTRSTLWLFNVKLIEIGKENIPEGSCLFLFSHSSFFDVFALAAAAPYCRFGAKIELFKIPIFGPAMRGFGVLPIARQQREKVFQVYDEAKERVAKGEKFALSPEGGRNIKEQLLPFKAGPFIFAINSGMPLVPVVIKGAFDVLPKGHILPNTDRWQREIEIHFLPKVEVDGVSIEDRGVLQNQVFEMMNPYFEMKSQ